MEQTKKVKQMLKDYKSGLIQAYNNGSKKPSIRGVASKYHLSSELITVALTMELAMSNTIINDDYCKRVIKAKRILKKERIDNRKIKIKNDHQELVDELKFAKSEIIFFKELLNKSNATVTKSIEKIDEHNDVLRSTNKFIDKLEERLNKTRDDLFTAITKYTMMDQYIKLPFWKKWTTKKPTI